MENINFNGKNISVIGENRETTIIDGGQNGSVVQFINGEDANTSLVNFSIINGYTGWDDWGAGISCINSSPQLSNLLITNNFANIYGGGVYFSYSESNVTNVEIRNNTAHELDTFTVGDGGGIYISNSILSFDGISVTHNIAKFSGAGISINNNSIVFINNSIVTNNEAENKGGGIYLAHNNSLFFSNSLLAINYSSGHGGGIFISAGSNVNLNNSTISINYVGEGDVFGAGIYSDGGTANLINSIVYYNRREGDYGINYNLNGYTMDILNEYSVSYSDIEGDENWIPEGTGNVSITPGFNDYWNGDFSLQIISPCIDVGDPNSELDPDGTRADMGAFYFNQIENPIIYSCTDPEACNYDETANVDDGSCEYYDECEGCCYEEFLAIEECDGGGGCFIPQCTENCEWEPMQCWGSIGYCWCVDENGIEIEGTSQPSWEGLPDCQEIELGDINSDGEINVIDIVQLVSFILGNNTPDETSIIAADLNNDGILNILDVVQLVNIILAVTQNTIIDIDGNVYETIQIGEQLWMAENLKVTHFNNGDAIPTGYSTSEWDTIWDDAYAVYDDDPSNAENYGNLYNWFAIDDSRGICPENYHIPTDDEWYILLEFLGGAPSGSGENWLIAGGKMKDVGTIEEGDGLWHTPNEGATNESGFVSIPGGFRHMNGDNFVEKGFYSMYWSSTEEYYADAVFMWYLRYDTSRLYRGMFGWQAGLSVRCIAD